MKILIFNRHYLPGFKAGGPIRSLANLVEMLGDEIEFFIVTTDRDLMDPEPYPNLMPGGWIVVSKAKVRYLARNEQSLWTLRRLIAEVAPDKIYLNSFFDRIFTARILIALKLHLIPAIPCLIAPRGEFSPGALALRKLRKIIYLAFFRAFKPAKGLSWHASTKLEAIDIARTVPSGPDRIRIAMDLSAPNNVDVLRLWQERPRGAALKVCFLSRISPKKNLLLALQALSLVKANVVFDIYGPKEDVDYWARCEDAIAQLPAHVNAHHKGCVSHEKVASTLSHYDLFLFPTLGENFGHVIIEALGAGVPVLISDQTPWNDVHLRGAGWALSGGAADFAACIDQAASWTTSEQQQARRSSVSYANSVSISQTAVDENTMLFS